MRKYYYDLLCAIESLLVGCLIYIDYWFDPKCTWLSISASTLSVICAGLFFISFLEGKHDDRI